MRTATRRATVYGGNRSIPAPEAPVPVAGADILAGIGSFTSSTGWSTDASVSIGSGVVSWSGAQAAAAVYKTALTVGVWYSCLFDLVTRTAGTFGLELGFYIAPKFSTPAAAVVATGLANGTALGIKTASSGAGTCDNLLVYPLTLSSLISTRPYASADCDISVAVTRTAGTQAGISARVDSASTPANFLIAYLDGSGNVKVDKCVSGTYTNVISGAVTYGAGYILRLVCNGNNVSAYYNGTQVGTTQTVSDAGIVGNKNHGLFSTYASNSFSGYVAA